MLVYLSEVAHVSNVRTLPFSIPGIPRHEVRSYLQKSTCLALPRLAKGTNEQVSNSCFFFPLNGPGNGRVIDVDEIVRVHCSSVEIGYMHMIITVSLAHRYKVSKAIPLWIAISNRTHSWKLHLAMSCHALSLSSRLLFT